MNIEKFPEVLFLEDWRGVCQQGKFVFLSVTEDATKKESVFVSFGKCFCHEIVREAQEKASKLGLNLGIEVQGGGFIIADWHQKQLYIFGGSVDYGEADQERVADLLHAEYPDFTILIKPTSCLVPRVVHGAA